MCDVLDFMPHDSLLVIEVYFVLFAECGKSMSAVVRRILDSNTHVYERDLHLFAEALRADFQDAPVAINAPLDKIANRWMNRHNPVLS